MRPEPDGAAIEWIERLVAGEVEGFAPDLVFPETANALAGYVRARVVAEKRAGAILQALVRLPLEVIPGRQLVPAAHRIALARGLTVYDAYYLAIADALEAVLVTADRRLADAAAHSALLS
ncbi:MAG: type II toxin-antitoxin system VapC family toxin [Actinomycetota bacterium]|nr:type II toxin-antitoxin system VapC family toxin [Actinomycetota bacterium]